MNEWLALLITGVCCMATWFFWFITPLGGPLPPFFLWVGPVLGTLAFLVVLFLAGVRLGRSR